MTLKIGKKLEKINENKKCFLKKINQIISFYPG